MANAWRPSLLLLRIGADARVALRHESEPHLRSPIGPDHVRRVPKTLHGRVTRRLAVADDRAKAAPGVVPEPERAGECLRGTRVAQGDCLDLSILCRGT